nr:MAG TPA: hypothetical protein [Caudoviricetes sp.]
MYPKPYKKCKPKCKPNRHISFCNANPIANPIANPNLLFPLKSQNIQLSETQKRLPTVQIQVGKRSTIV